VEQKDNKDEFVMELIGCQNRLRGFLRCLLVTHEDLDDVLQNTNRVLLKKSHTFTPGTDFWAWACQVARFEVLAHHRRQQRDRHLFDLEFIQELACRAESQLQVQSDLKAALEECLKQLSKSSGELLESRYAEGQSVQEIAMRLGRPVGSIRQTLYRIRQQLRSCLESSMQGSAT
jgi:RNA polymerase sigma-70 factor (ECF subfamily)